MPPGEGLPYPTTQIGQLTFYANFAKVRVNVRASYRSLNMRKGTKKVDGVGRRQAVLDVLWTLGTHMTVHDMAYNLHIEPSTYLRKIMNELVDDGYLTKYSVRHRSSGKITNKMVYSLKVDEAQAAQMEMFQ